MLVHKRKGDRRLRVGICGAGDFGSYFAPFVSEVAEVVAVCDPNPAMLQAFISQTRPEVAQFNECGQMLAETDMDAIVITSPNFTHKAVTLAAAAHGRHVFCEKAMALSVPECWEMVHACDQAGVRLMVGHKRRLRAPWERMIELRERVGEMVAATACLYYDARPYDRRGWWTRMGGCGGTLFLTGVHTIDWLRALAGDVVAVRAVRAPVVDSRYEYPDTLHVTLNFASGAIASLNVSFNYPLATFRESVGVTVVCRDGGMRLNPFLDHIDIMWQTNSDISPVFERFDDLGFEQAYRKELGDFVRWIQDGVEPCLTWREGLRCVEVMEAANRSDARGGAVVHLPLYPELEPV